ncbi:MAG TPA: metallophosphoesterase family protein [Ktedonobacteraceae bacterium]|nr:metallophosphoesterase family protein [Ktedonobacteraceae bacterium]
MRGTVTDHHRFLLSEHLTQIHHLEQAIERITAEITRRFTPPSLPEEETSFQKEPEAAPEMVSDPASPQEPPSSPQAALSWSTAVVLLCSIPGIGERAAIGILIEEVRSFSWTRGYLSAAGWLDWFTSLPLEVRLILPDGTRLLGVHASPGRDDGPGLQPRHRDDKLGRQLAGCEADVVIVGHTHVPLDRQVGKLHAINLGSISNPVTPGLQATYVLLDADEQGYRIQLRRVDYDREAVIKAIEHSRHPTPSFLIGFMRGERVASSDPGFFQAGRRAENRKEK